MMAWCLGSNDQTLMIDQVNTSSTSQSVSIPDDKAHKSDKTTIVTCPSCGHKIELQDQGGINDLRGLPAGVKFDPSDQEILEHLEAKSLSDALKLHPLIDEFIPTIDGENGICYTHPQKLPGVRKDGQVRHYFHRPSKAYARGTRKRRKIHNEEDGSETRWHKTGKTRPVFFSGCLKGFKKILVLYTNYGRHKKPEKTNWVMHQYHLGSNEEEKDGDLVVSKVFYQNHPRQCGSSNKESHGMHNNYGSIDESAALLGYYNAENSAFISFDQGIHSREIQFQLIPDMVVHGPVSSVYPLITNSRELERK